MNHYITYILPRHVAVLHDVSLHGVKINPGHYYAAALGLRQEVGNWIANGELNHEVGIVGELPPFAVVATAPAMDPPTSNAVAAGILLFLCSHHGHCRRASQP